MFTDAVRVSCVLEHLFAWADFYSEETVLKVCVQVQGTDPGKEW